MKTYSKYNFHRNTFCVFKEVTTAEIEGLKTNFVSKSGSSYIFTAKGVYRTSNHWGRAANCKWRLQSHNLEESSRTKVGYANWNEFHPIDEITKLYYIEVDLEEKTAQYLHKSSASGKTYYLRTATETTKRVKEIRSLLANPKKLEYWEVALDFDTLLSRVIHQMIATDATLLQIKHTITVVYEK